VKERLIPYTGQRYECVMCGECCHNRAVPLTKIDIDRLEHHLGEEVDFSEYLVNKGYFVLSRRIWDNGCVLLRDNKCSVHAIKPLVCRLFPFAVYPAPEDPDDTENAYTLADGTVVYLYVDIACPGVHIDEIVSPPSWLLSLVQRIRLEMALTRFYYEDTQDNAD